MEEEDKEDLLAHSSSGDPPFAEDQTATKSQSRRTIGCVEAKVFQVSNTKPLCKRKTNEKGESSRTFCKVYSHVLVDKKRQLRLDTEVIQRQTLSRFESSTCTPLNGEQGSRHIDGLPPELLDHIFSYLDVRQRIRLELVCKRWRMLGKFVKWSEPKRLIFDPWRRRENPTKGKWVLDDVKLEAILSRCGDFVRQIVLVKLVRPKCNPSYQVLVTDDSLKTIAAHCPNLETLNLQHLHLNRTLLLLLAQGCGKLKNVFFSKFGTSDEGFSDFYGMCHSLESLTLEPERNPTESLPLIQLLQRTSVYGEGLDCLNPNLKILNLRKCDNLQAVALKQLVKTCHSLREIHLTVLYPERVKAKLVIDVCRHYKNTLKVLELFLPLKRFNWCETLSVLYNLEELSLHFMQSIVLDCPCYKSNSCFAKLSPNLKILSALDTSMLSDDSEEYILSKLFVNTEHFEELRLPRSNLSPATLKLILKHGGTLKKLDLCHYNASNCNWCQFFRELPNLVELRLMRCSEVNDNLAAVLANHCTQIKVLDIALTSVTDQGLIQLASLPKLAELDVTDCGRLTDDGVQILAANGRIEVLRVATTVIAPCVTDVGCCSLATFCPNFRLLDVSNAGGTTKITNDLVAAFRKSKREGFLREVVELLVGGTAVQDQVETCDGLQVYFVYHQDLKNPNEYQGFLEATC